MNRLNTEERARIVSCLIEGCSLRATVRLTGFSRKGVCRVMADVGDDNKVEMDRKFAKD
jgi:hypothetical protein